MDSAPSTWQACRPPRRVSSATRCVKLRRLLAGDWDVFEGTHSRMRIAPRKVPVYVAAAGPRTIRMAGEVADGLLLGAGLSFDTFEKTRSLLDEGARSAGRDPGEVDFCINLLTAIRPTREEALRWAGPLIVLRLNEPDWLKENGIDSQRHHHAARQRRALPGPDARRRPRGGDQPG